MIYRLLRIFSMIFFTLTLGNAIPGYATNMVLRDGEDRSETPATFTLTMDDSSDRAKTIGWQIEVILAKEGRGTPWIDWNGDGECQDDERLAYDSYPQKLPCFHQILANPLKIYADLEMLSCPGNSIAEIEMEGAFMLKSLICFDNPISEIDLSGAPKLESLQIYMCQLSEIDLSHSSCLNHLDCGGNEISEIDLSHTNKLISLNVSENSLANLNTSPLPDLKDLVCYRNELSKLDLTKNKKLSLLDITGNKRLTPPDLSNNLSLHTYYFSDLGWNDFGSIEGLEKLRAVSCDLNNFSETEANRLVEALPTIPQDEENGVIWVVDTEDIDGVEEHNHFSSVSVAKLREKRWLALDFKGHQNDGNNPYDGIPTAINFIDKNDITLLCLPTDEPGVVILHAPYALIGSQIIIYTIKGEEVNRFILKDSAQRLDLSSLPHGNYILHCYCNQKGKASILFSR